MPLITVNKAKSLNAQLYYRFDSEEMYINSKTSFTANDSTVKYNGLYKVAHSKGNLYMFLDKRQAYIADVSVFTEEQRATLKEALVNQLGAKKVKWKL